MDVSKLAPGWDIVDNRLYKKYTFPNFKEALAFVNEVGRIAEEENHHPNISFTWGKVELTIWTHEADGLTEKDFILAKKIGELHASTMEQQSNS